MFARRSSNKRNKEKREVDAKSPLKLLEPFQEAIDEALEVDWGLLNNEAFPLSDVNADKSTASQAVAFVIRASRRGVVPLCAEVADLLKEKNRLEGLIEEHKDEISRLLQNQVLPRSPSPIPPEMTHFCMQTVQEMDCQTIMTNEASSQTENLQLSCTRLKCFNEEDEMPSVKESEITGVIFDCGSKFMLRCTCPDLKTRSTQSPVQVSVATNTGLIKERSKLGYFDHEELEEIHQELKEKYKKVKTEVKKEVVKNIENEDILKRAKLEIVSLQKTIQDIQSKEYEKIKEEEKKKLEETYSVDAQHDDFTINDVDSDASDFNVLKSDVLFIKNKQEKGIIPIVTSQSSRPTRSSIFPGPILGCKCNMCLAFFKSSGLLGFASSPYVTDSSGRNPVLRDLRKLIYLQNSKLQVHPNDHVLTRRNRTGTVRYVGHVDGGGTPSVVYVGVELNEPDGRHDGYLHGRRYFFTPPNSAIFLPIEDVICVINKKIALPVMRQRHLAIKQKKVKHRAVAPTEHKNSFKSFSSSRASSSGESTNEDSKLPAVR